MSNTHNTASLVVKRNFNVSITSLFDAWTIPDVFLKWFGPPGFQCVEMDADVSVGGGFHIHMVGPDPKKIHYHIRGTYRDVIQNKRLVFTWKWDGPIRNETETLVEIEFNEKQDCTELVLSHFYLPNEDEVNGHKSGWLGSFSCLQTFLEESNND